MVTAFLIVLYMIALVLIHYTFPSVAWLSEEQLGVLGNLYTKSVRFGVPFMLVSNAWLIWYASRSR